MDEQVKRRKILYGSILACLWLLKVQGSTLDKAVYHYKVYLDLDRHMLGLVVFLRYLDL